MSQIPNHPRIALLQLNSALADKASNLAKVEKMLANLEKPVSIACLPELFSTGYSLDVLGDRIFDLAEPIPEGDTSRKLAEMARRFDLAVVAGLKETFSGITRLKMGRGVLFKRTFAAIMFCR